MLIEYMTSKRWWFVFLVYLKSNLGYSVFNMLTETKIELLG